MDHIWDEESGVSLLLIIGTLASLVCLLFSWFYIYRYQLSYNFCIHILSCVEFICYIAVLIMIIVDLCSLLKLHLGLACKCGYFHRVYTLPTLIASPLQCILGSGAWQPTNWIFVNITSSENDQGEIRHCHSLHRGTSWIYSHRCLMTYEDSIYWR